MQLTVRLYATVQPGKPSQLVQEALVEPDANNAYPELVVYNARYYIPTPMRGAYREVAATPVLTARG